MEHSSVSFGKDERCQKGRKKLSMKIARECHCSVPTGNFNTFHNYISAP